MIISTQMPPTLSDLNWKRLKDSKCPKCKSQLVHYPSGDFYKCPTGDFSISGEKFNQIVNNLYKTGKPYKIQTDGMMDESLFDPPERSLEDGLFN